MSIESNVALVRRFWDDLYAHQFTRIGAYFTDDAVYDDVPIPAALVVGPAAIVRKLEAGQGNLDESIQAYERGARLKAHCERKLREATMRIEAIARGADGEITAKPVALGDASQAD